MSLTNFNLPANSMVAQDRSCKMPVFDQDRSSSESDFDFTSRTEVAGNQSHLRTAAEAEQYRRRSHPPLVLKLLKKWLHAHRTNPYPNDDEKTELCRATGLDRTQLNNWFINARRRILFRVDGEQEPGENQNQGSRSNQQRNAQSPDSSRSPALALGPLSPRHKKRRARRSEPYRQVSPSVSPSSPASPASSSSSSESHFSGFPTMSMDYPGSPGIKSEAVKESCVFDPSDPETAYLSYPPYYALLLIVKEELAELNQNEVPMMS